ncbi:MAG: hypothetical protein ABJN69_16820 [Hellea sp.]
MKPLHGKIRMGMVSRGQGAFIGDVHRLAARLHVTKTDNCGFATPILDSKHGDNEKNLMKQAGLDSAEMLKAAGRTNIGGSFKDGNYLSPPRNGIDEMGAARRGRDPKTSVLCDLGA